jgi:hypothetical protein
MIPRLHPKGHSFKGAAAYLLHDKNQATTSHRVAWVQTHNLATDNPHVGWKVMAATAQSQERLKAQAGIKNTGRKSTAHALHFSLSWTAEEAKGLTREEMLRAAHGALKALSATDRQAIIVSHNDEPHPHVHILLNRVSADDGRILTSSKEKLALSQWAEAYERERGQILCEERAVNNAARQRGEYTRAKARSRAVLGTDKERNAQAADRKEKLAKLARQGREMVARHAAAWQDLEATHNDRTRGIRAASRRSLYQKVLETRARYRENWVQLLREHQEQRAAYDHNEGTLIGRAHNRLRAVDFGAILRAGDRRAAITAAFRALSSSGSGLYALKRTQGAQVTALARRQLREERDAAKECHAERLQQLAENRQHYLALRSTLQLTNSLEQAALRASWESSKRSRGRGDTGTREIATPEPERGNEGNAPNVREAFERAAPGLSETETLRTGGDERARRIAEFRERFNKPRDNSRDRDHDR